MRNAYLISNVHIQSHCEAHNLSEMSPEWNRIAKFAQNLYNWRILRDRHMNVLRGLPRVKARENLHTLAPSSYRSDP